ncbi:hypothetical protein NQ314_004633 [Rhamnusium bicolor]|uniref:Aminoacyl-transfer RNA synthetases class-II family profile domain-containing protein n=1 Tax=Rhamnusium bicolor TaxID=1586634 RepID=A0AAV8ZLU0_9CUCU|nr:hypothetical protein NQ314_004633 [Rhamnusium bicolor]
MYYYVAIIFTNIFVDFFMMSAFLNRFCGKTFHAFLKNINKIKAFSQGVNLCERRQNDVDKLYSTSSKSKQVYLIDEDENSNKSRVSSFNKYTNRSYTCGELRSNNIGESVNLCGWLEYQRMNKFVVLRDSYGETQLLINEKDLKTQRLLENLPFESIIQIRGTVLSRPKAMINEKQVTGEIEVLIDDLKVVNKAKNNLPFNIREFQKAKETLRMQYRYLDLRFPQMQRNLRERSRLIMKMREFLFNNNFVDVETPTLFKATPGQFKQMLMAGAIDRYFQIAHCYRDEGVRSDRQPEFTQLDIEMSFTNVDGVINLIEELLLYSWPEYLNPIAMKFQRISYKDALENYGNDKPDIRFEFKIQNCTELFKPNEKLVDDDFGAYFVKIPKDYANLNKQIKELMLGLAMNYPNAKFFQSKVNTPKEWTSKINKLLTSQVATKFVEENKLENDSVLFLAYGNKNEVLSLLGKVRLEYVNFLENLGISVRKKGMHFLWVVDFPLFEISEETGCLQSAHHPFTAPHPEDLHLLKSSPLNETLLDLLKIERNTMQHIIDMLGSGCPPHGGIALGLDRLLSILLGTTSIRDVIAFPKNFEGRDPLSGAPSYISEKDQKLYHIKSIPSNKLKN